MTEPFNTDLYDQHIDAMKARERSGEVRPYYCYPQGVRDAIEAYRNIERLAAYKRKRARYDRDMYIVETAAGEMYD